MPNGMYWWCERRGNESGSENLRFPTYSIAFKTTYWFDQNLWLYRPKRYEAAHKLQFKAWIM